MHKKTYTSVTLDCIMQKAQLSEKECAEGVLSLTRKGFRFEERAKKHRDQRNPFIFVGKHCTLTHRKDGRYQINMRSVDAAKVSDRHEFAFEIYSELLSLFNIIE